MKEFKGTKGDWSVNYNSYSVILQKSDDVLKDVDLYRHQYTDLRELDYNAKLISAAPELLEALQNIMDFPEDDLIGWSEESFTTITLKGSDFKKAIEAINKALD
tara:strand:+ start:9394 stop:9705 length:312 start_codon:yes stop_codon:yes gene_type:complete